MDAAERAQHFKILHYSAYGAVLGGLGGAFVGIGVLPGSLLGFLFVYGLVRLIVTGAARAAGTIYHPSGKSTPEKRDYSYEQSLAARGEFEEAIKAYELQVAEYPEDPEPYLRIGRLYRDELQLYDAAVAWLKRARTEARVSEGQEQLATEEIIEIYTHRLHTPRKAIPELALLCERFPDVPGAESRRRELEELREMLARERRDRG